MRTFLASALVALIGSALVTACGTVGPQATTYTAYQLTCCSPGDIERVWQPGTTVDLHWNQTASQVTTVNPSHRVVITGTLDGPYADVSTLKQLKAAAYQVRGSSVSFDDRIPPAADTVMTFLLPANLPPGFYNLNTSWDLGAGDSASGGSVVRVGQH